ncbi:MAG: type II toxin-antitoxin system VapC family toxin [Coriobacteriia bacterium]|nr:type II toxin-antitoxin system VapC family toxin [Coriobacteriia bacterium]
MKDYGHSAEQRIVVVDSSVAVKWYKCEGESGLDAAWALLEQHQTAEVTIAVPGHFAAEVLNGLQYARLGLDQVQAAAAALGDVDLVTVPLTRHLTEPAVTLARTHNLTINDALFPALATLLDAELVTADRAQARVTECRVRLLA